MQATLLSRLRCPACEGHLTLIGESAAWIETGTLVCTKCSHQYPIKNGMPHLHVDDARWQPKAAEASGWVKYHHDHQIYDQTGVDIDFQLPYFPHEPWLAIAHQFDIALELVVPQAGQWVLDIGAGRGWAAKHFALRGCHSVAIDVTDDEHVGLGRSRALMAQAGVVYDTLIADSEQLPFATASFDLVFCSAALHHTTDLTCLVDQIGRVLKHGGRLVAMNEPCVSDASQDDELRRTVLAEELSYGINETRPHLDDYRRVISHAGLQETVLLTPETYRRKPSDMVAWSHELGISPPTAFEQASMGQPGRWFKAWRPQHGVASVERLQVPQAWVDHLLRERGGSLILVATKP